MSIVKIGWAEIFVQNWRSLVNLQRIQVMAPLEVTERVRNRANNDRAPITVDSERI